MLNRSTSALALLLLLVACKDRPNEPPASDNLGAPTAPSEQRTTESQNESPPPDTPTCEPGQRICEGDAVVQCDADGNTGAAIETCKGGCRAGVCVDTCAINDVELVYLVDDLDGLYSFDPRKLPDDPFRRIGKLACDTTSTPNSMAVDRSGIAWIGYQNGTVHHASILDAHCLNHSSRPRGAPRRFGMGFVTDGPGSTTEKLFVAGPDAATKLATLGTENTPITWNEIASLAKREDNPELTGTGDGKLFAYFPAPDRGFVQQIERSTGKLVGTKWKLAGDEGEGVHAYAFAHWGGVFYVFTTIGENSAVHAIHMDNGRQELVKDHLPYTIVGAGVSTCAPLLEHVPE
jgi:hypothetical protein